MAPKGKLAMMLAHDDERQPIEKKSCAKSSTHAPERCTHDSRNATHSGRYGRPGPRPHRASARPARSRQGRRSVGRGSHVALESTETIRPFLWWMESEHPGRVDVDLATVGFNEQWRIIDHVDYTSLATVWATHSGDVQSAPSGAAEFIDIDGDKARSEDVQYLVMSVISFARQAFSTSPRMPDR